MLIEILTNPTIVPGISGILGAAIGAVVGGITTGLIIISGDKRKRKIDNIIKIINETGELQSAISEIGTLMFHITKDMFKQIRKKKYLKINQIVTEARDKFFKDSNTANMKIENFSFLLAREYILNQSMSREYKIILKNFLKIKAIREEMINAISTVNNIAINQQSINNLGQKFVNLIDGKNDEVDRFALKLMATYKLKLDKEEKSCLKKFLNWICKCCRKLFNCFINCFCECCECLNSENEKKSSAKKRGRKS